MCFKMRQDDGLYSVLQCPLFKRGHNDYNAVNGVSFDSLILRRGLLAKWPMPVVLD